MIVKTTEAEKWPLQIAYVRKCVVSLYCLSAFPIRDEASQADKNRTLLQVLNVRGFERTTSRF